MEFFVLLAFLISIANLIWNLSGFVLDQTYNYQTRKKTYNGTKAVAWMFTLYFLYVFTIPAVF